MNLKVLIVQNNPIIGDIRATLDNVRNLLANYSDRKPDLIAFPEVWSSGWECSSFQNCAENLENSITLEFLKNVAIEFNSTVIGGSFIQQTQSGLKNTCPVFSAKGNLVATYDKIHLFSHKGSEEDKYINAGNKLKILDFGCTKVGLSICYDIRFPEIYRRYSSLGVEVFINVAAWLNTKPMHWDIMHRARAIENQCYMIVANQTGKIKGDAYNLGHSMVVDVWGDIVAKLESDENCLYTEICMNKIKELRENFPLLRDRKDLSFASFDYEEIKINV